MQSQNLTLSQRNTYAMKLITWFHNTWKRKSWDNKLTLSQFTDEIFFDHELNKNFKDEDLPDLGLQVAMYLLDHPYSSESKLKSLVESAALDIPDGKIPSYWLLGQTVVHAASKNDIFDYANLYATATVETFKQARDVAVIAAKTYFTYKSLALAASLIGVIAMVMQSKSKRNV